ncbi:MAG: GGDEF domain-containing phosphodiesterase [Eubacterium sp.]|nr:GGDEF domain-containing phosphodiesterase [Eubacterium sp.]
MSDISERLYSENFKAFIKGVGESSNSIQGIADYTRNSMHLIAEDLHMGRLEAIILAKPNMIDRVGFDGQELLYQEKSGYNWDLHSMHFETENGVSITMNAYPVKDYYWTDEDKDDLYFVCKIFFQLFERARMISIFRRVAITDSMTGALNVNGFISTGTPLVKMHVPGEYSIAFSNIKNLKIINREMGNLQGDNVLRGYVEKINSYLLPDELVARPGGDNFICLIKTKRLYDFIRFLDEMTLTLDYEGKPRSVNINCRIGICKIEEDMDVGKAITSANTALLETRKEGASDIIWFDETLHRREYEAKQTTFLFANALINKEFKVYYQPKVKLSDGSLCGSEALVRWARDGQIIPPMSFIPALEFDGSICELDFYVFEEVCRDIRIWLDNGIEPVTVSINFSRFHIKNDDFAPKLISIMDRYNVDSKYIEVELTESACYEDYERLKKFLAVMKDKGVKVSIDDFGTGYSSLSLLKDLMVNVIKLDQSFIRGISSEAYSKDSTNNDMIVIKNIVKMVGELDMDIIAEGVETLEEANFLKEIDCDMAQGYLYDRPMSHDDFEVVLRGTRIYSR